MTIFLCIIVLEPGAGQNESGSGDTEVVEQQLHEQAQLLCKQEQLHHDGNGYCDSTEGVGLEQLPFDDVPEVTAAQ